MWTRRVYLQILKYAGVLTYPVCNLDHMLKWNMYGSKLISVQQLNQAVESYIQFVRCVCREHVRFTPGFLKCFGNKSH